MPVPKGVHVATLPSASDRRQLADLARAYYLEQRSKVQLAQDFGLSRFQVARMLREAVETGVVTITIEADPRAHESRAERLAQHLGLRSVRIVDTSTEADPLVSMGRAVLARVGRATRPGMRIGLSWSRTLDAAAAYVPALPRCTVVQLAGALRLGADEAGAEPGPATPGLFARLGQDAAVHVVRLYAPLLVNEAETAADLVRLPEITSALREANRLDLAVVSVGAWAEGLSSVHQKCTPAQRRAGTEDGAVAEVSGRLLAADGSPVTTLDDRVISVGLEQLRAAETTVGVVRGAGRAAALRAAAASGILDTAIIDEDLAGALLSELDGEDA